MWPISSSRRPSGAASRRLPRATRRGRAAAVEAELGRFLEPRLGLRDLADFAGQADLAEIDRAGAGRLIACGGGERGRDREVGRRFAHAQAAGDVQVDVGRRSAAAPARVSSTASSIASRPESQPMTDRRGEPPGLGASRAWISTRTGRVPSRPANTAAAGDVAAAFGKEQGGGVGHLGEAVFGHLEHADLVGGAEAVLHRAQDAELVAAVAFEIQHRVHHVLQHARAGERAVLGDVADQRQGEIAALWPAGSARSWRRGPG